MSIYTYGYQATQNEWVHEPIKYGCEHEVVNVGFNTLNYVCKICDMEFTKEAAAPYLKD